MEKRKRKLYPYEKVIFGLKILMAGAAFVFLILYAVDADLWALYTTWMCISVAQIANSCIRWDEQRKWNIFGLCFFSVMFVILALLLVWPLLNG